jgi:aerobic-type carbon monoxide dehydrogenase small subunit (CoxS/CutS family)
MDVDVTINGFKTILRVEPHENLRDVLRKSGYLSVKKGCDVGGCGACTVLVDDMAVYSCCLLAGWAEGKSIFTLEGLSQDGSLDPIQKAFMEKGAAQCGFCTPGFIMMGKYIVEHKRNATEAEVRKALAGNLCRCTGYAKIVEAVMAAKQEGVSK